MESRNPNNELLLAAKNGLMYDLVNALEAKGDVNNTVLTIGNTKSKMSAPILLALKNGHTEIVIKLLQSNAMLNLQDKRTRQLLSDHLKHCTIAPILIRLFAALQECGLKDETLINLLPDNYSSFENQNLNADIVDYLRSIEEIDERIHFCQRALNIYDPIGHVVHLPGQDSRWKASEKIISAIEEILANAKKQSNPTDAAVVEMKPIEKVENDGFVLMDDGSFPVLNNNGSVAAEKKDVSIFNLIIKGKKDEVIALVTAKPALLAATHQHYDSPLYLAINQNETAIAVELIKMGAPIVSQKKFSASICYLPNASRNTAILDALLSKHTDNHNLKKVLLDFIFKSVHRETDGKLVFEWFEVMAKYFKSYEIKNALGYKGCLSETKRAVARALYETEDKILFVKRYEAIMWPNTPLSSLLRTNGSMLRPVLIDDLIKPYAKTYDLYKAQLASFGFFAQPVITTDATEIQAFEMDDFGSPDNPHK